RSSARTLRARSPDWPVEWVSSSDTFTSLQRCPVPEGVTSRVFTQTTVSPGQREIAELRPKKRARPPKCVQSEPMALIHSRMPVILPEDAYDEWLESGDVAATGLVPMFRPYPNDGIEARPISTRVNNVRNDDPDLVEACREWELAW
ncbi:hypothetical protein EPN52_02025, partial [bacterium]